MTSAVVVTSSAFEMFIALTYAQLFSASLLTVHEITHNRSKFRYPSEHLKRLETSFKTKEDTVLRQVVYSRHREGLRGYQHDFEAMPLDGSTKVRTSLLAKSKRKVKQAVEALHNPSLFPSVALVLLLASLQLLPPQGSRPFK